MMDEKMGKVTKAREAVATDLKAADPAMWHRIIMCILIGFAGIALIGGVVMDFVLERQTQELRHMPVIGIAENAVLPQDQYFIYQVYFDDTNHTHYLVSSTSGGVVERPMVVYIDLGSREYPEENTNAHSALIGTAPYPSGQGAVFMGGTSLYSQKLSGTSKSMVSSMGVLLDAVRWYAQRDIALRNSLRPISSIARLDEILRPFLVSRTTCVASSICGKCRSPLPIRMR